MCGLLRIPLRPRQPRRAHLRLRRSPQINRRRRKRDIASGFDWLPCQSTVIAVFLIAPCSWRVRLVVRTQPSQGWYTGSTPVRAAQYFVTYDKLANDAREIYESRLISCVLMISVSRFEAIGAARRDIFRPIIVSVRRASGREPAVARRRVTDVARLHASAKSAPLTILHALKLPNV